MGRAGHGKKVCSMMGSMKLLGWGCTLLLLSPVTYGSMARPAVLPETVINVRFYDVSAPDLKSLAAALDRVAPRDQDKVALGKASYRLDWRLELDQGEKQCLVRQIVVSTDATLLIPRWLEKTKATKQDRQRWERITASLLDYEARHKEMVLQSATRIGIALADLPAESSCDVLRYGAWKAGMKELEQGQRRIDSFQRQTRYGEMLGLRWPGEG